MIVSTVERERYVEGNRSEDEIELLFRSGRTSKLYARVRSRSELVAHGSLNCKAGYFHVVQLFGKINFRQQG